MKEHTDATFQNIPDTTLPSSDGSHPMTGNGNEPGVTEQQPSTVADWGDNDAEGQPLHNHHRPTKAPGRVTSFLGVFLLAIMIALALLPTVIHHVSPQDPLDLVILYVGCLTAMMFLVTPTVLLGLRSASKPKGTVGRGRGLVTVIIATLIPVATFTVVLFNGYGRAYDLMHSGLVSQSVAPDGSKSLVSPVGTKELSPEKEQVLGTLRLMPDIIIEEGDDVAIESEAGEVTVDGKEVTLNGDMTDAIAIGIEEAKKYGYKVSLGADGKLHGTDKDGNAVTISLTETGINIQTNTDMTFQELIDLGGGYLSSQRNP